jgi:hypothetical protein
METVFEGKGYFLTRLELFDYHWNADISEPRGKQVDEPPSLPTETEIDDKYLW